MSTEFTERLIELSGKTGHVGIARDLALAELIPADQRCDCCDGSGNMMYSMFYQCLACEGDGKSRGKQAEDEADAEFARRFPQPSQGGEK